MRVLPILFNTDMVQAILDGRKTVTRRAIKYKYSNTEMKMRTDKYGTRLVEIQKDVEGETYGKNEDGSTWHKLRGYIEPKPPCQPGDILYVRETWNHYCYKNTNDNISMDGYVYKASPELWGKLPQIIRSMVGKKWVPSIHMPKAAARIWLKVTDVRVERLRDATNPLKYPHGKDNTIIREGVKYACDFIAIWNKTIKKTNLDTYGWDANPWVWVIEFERCEKPEPCIIAGVEPAEDKRPCIGYGVSDVDDEPCEMCKGCTKHIGYEEEK